MTRVAGSGTEPLNINFTAGFPAKHDADALDAQHERPPRAVFLNLYYFVRHHAHGAETVAQPASGMDTPDSDPAPGRRIGERAY
jgi:hypothetical protein